MNSQYHFQQLINGAWIDASTGAVWQLVDPATEQVIAEMPYGGADDAQAAVDAAYTAQPGWARLTAWERGAILQRAAAWIRGQIDALAAITTEESGKPLRESVGEWTTGANLLDWFAEEGKRAHGRLIPSRAASKRISLRYQPVGVVGVITAWNFPVYNPARAWAAALAAGCTVVGRPSEYTPRSAMLFAQALHDSGAPAGVVNVINGDPEAMGRVMLDDPHCRKVSFTGSTRVGKLLMDGASKTVTKLALEMGGNAPVLIFLDVDVEKVARAAVVSKFRNNGQVCIAPQRFYVHTQIVEEFVDSAAHAAKALKLGPGSDPATDVGPLINARQRERVEAMVRDAAAEGADVLAGGARPAGSGYFYEPTVLLNVTPDMAVYREEVFGPVMPIVPFSDADEALALANALEYGLAAYVQTSDVNTYMKMIEGLDYGIVSVNDWFPSAPEAPFGGMKGSGMGRECGTEGLMEYMEAKTVFLGGLP
ncbi:MAG TPA: NAD-dependent succinate-semialdehyde dehydrogenase [Candidatus Limnocylindrales bacterium]|nr:NAD-dependent succinate-semialdehyde dehydrogenase [Candidatus Limnocylindrales bacterium]